MRRVIRQVLRVVCRSLAPAIAMIAFGACESEPKAGDACKPKDIRCVDMHTELACQNGVFIEAPCKGPKGCGEGKDMLICDFSGNATGDPCSTDDEGNARCIDDGKKWIICRGGEYAIENCRGEKGCYRAGSLRCDQSISAEGDPCAGKSNACSLDRKQVVTCKDGRFTPTAACKGEAGCSIVDKQVNCDLGKKEEDQ